MAEGEGWEAEMCSSLGVGWGWERCRLRRITKGRVLRMRRMGMRTRPIGR